MKESSNCKKEMDLPSIVSKGDELETLKALRDKLAVIIDKSTSGRDIAAMTRQLREILTRIEELETQRNTPDEIEAILKEASPGIVHNRRTYFNPD